MRPFSYDIILYNRESLDQPYYLNFAIQVTIGMHKEDSCVFNDEFVGYSYLELVKDRDNKSEIDKKCKALF